MNVNRISVKLHIMRAGRWRRMDGCCTLGQIPVAVLRWFALRRAHKTVATTGHRAFQWVGIGETTEQKGMILIARR